MTSKPVAGLEEAARELYELAWEHEYEEYGRKMVRERLAAWTRQRERLVLLEAAKGLIDRYFGSEMKYVAEEIAEWLRAKDKGAE